MEIDTLEAGRELDALVAEYVFGWTDLKDSRHWKGPGLECWRPTGPPGKIGTHPGGFVCEVPHYSTMLVPAWEIVEKYKERMQCMAWEPHESEWSVTIWVDLPNDKLEGGYWTSGNAASFPLAVCRAALKAVTERQP